MHKRAQYAKKALGIKGKMFAKKRHAEKIQMKKTIAMHEESEKKHKAEDGQPKVRPPRNRAPAGDAASLHCSGLLQCPRWPQGAAWPQRHAYPLNK